MRKQTSVFGSLLIAIIFFVSGFMGWRHFTQPMLKEARASEKWPTAQGVITAAELGESTNSDGTIMYSANVYYDYTVNNRQYSSSGITMADGSSSMKNSEVKKLKKYAKGTSVAVYYDPEFPESTVLEPGAGLWLGLLLRLPLLFCAVSVLIVLGLLARIKRMLFGR
ncbi:Protein of unknown function [Mariniphaga anaerophila]|uniref:DUF3592 domain-containing protein n=1 Tax=Mariniphaga anaerophila TaxID=1484053 RepID=A0A1M5DDY5_9BACT|nr:DUF3592 domain-containing protein [Mariniphaga anaerophila]SHF65197.1 Protein of unknown function [Mariniphaga anaerophila]